MNRKKLLGAIEKVKPAVTSTSLTEQNNMVFFNKKTVKSFNEEILIIFPIRTTIAGGFPANELITLLQKIKDEKIEITQYVESSPATKKTGILEIEGSTTKAELKMSDVDFPQVDLPEKWKALPDDFIEGIKYCRFSVAEPGTILGNIYLTKDKIISCDNYRITEYTIEKKSFRRSRLIPSSTINALIPFQPISFSSNNSWLFFKNENNAIFCIRKTEEKYPDIESILNARVKGIKIKLPDELKEALQRTKILSDEDITTGNRIINIVIKNNKLVCHGECAVGQIDETIKIDYKGKEISFAIVPDFLSEILDKTQTMTVGETSLKFKTKNLIHIIQLIK